MPSIFWYNDNQFRDYPFILRVEPLAETTDTSSLSAATSLFHLPPSAILDFGAVMDIDAGFDVADGHNVYLHSVSRFDDVFTFKLRTTAAMATNHELVFTRELTTTEYEITHVDATTIIPEAFDALNCATRSKWSGFLVTGKMDDLALLIANGDTLYADDGLWQIEPARIQNLASAYLRSVTLANASRVMATVPEYCSESAAINEDTVIINTRCMAGPIRWKEGFNCAIRQDNNNNAIVISAAVGVGAGVPCEEVPLFDGEVPPTGSQFLSGGPGCNEVVKSINGVTGANISIIPGNGFRIEPSADDPNTLVIDRSLEDFAYCTGVDTNSSVSNTE